MSKDDENDVLSADIVAFNKAKDSMKKLIESIEKYNQEKEDLKKYIMYDRIKND